MTSEHTPGDPVQIPEPVIEYAGRLAGGAMLVRPDSWDRAYPLAEWIEHGQRHGGKVYWRRVIIVEEWTEVERGATS